MRHLIKWGFIGCGRVVQNKSGPAFNIESKSIVQSIARRNYGQAKESASLLGAEQYFDSYEEMLTSDIDAVYIATPPGKHLEHAKLCVKYEKPIYIEKPFARNYAESKEICEIFDKANIPIFLAHYRRAHPRFIDIKQKIQQGAIGSIISFQGQLSRIHKDDENHPWMYNTELSGGGKFFDIAPHMLDVIIYLLGDYEEAKSFCKSNYSRNDLEDAVTSSIKMKNGILGTINFSLCSYNKKDSLRIIGTEGVIDLSIHGAWGYRIENNDGVTEYDFEAYEYIQSPMIENVVNYLRGDRTSVICNGREALETYRLIDDILSDFYGGRENGFWDK